MRLQRLYAWSPVVPSRLDILVAVQVRAAVAAVLGVQRLESPVEVTGRIRARLWVSSSARDTDFTVKLCDVYPDGRSMLVTDGILRARHRKSMARDDLLTPGEVYSLDVDLWSTSLILARRHRIRVAVSSSNAPRFAPNPNTGARFPSRDGATVAINTLLVDAKQPSCILLPLAGAHR